MARGSSGGLRRHDASEPVAAGPLQPIRHESAYWEHVGHRWHGAFSRLDFQPLLSPLTTSIPRAIELFVLVGLTDARLFVL